MTVGGQANKAQAYEILRIFLKSYARDVIEFDSAHMYPSKEKLGLTNQLLGEILREHPDEFEEVKISSKANPWVEGKLSPASVRHQCEASYKSLGRKMNIFYLHAPDPSTPIEETLGEIDRLHREGLFEEFGLSNYAAWQVMEIYAICVRSGFVLPTVYQGPYSFVCRTIELELLPCLRHLKMRFYAYNATAGGLLTAKYESEDKKPTEGRFVNPMYLDRYWKPEYFEAVECVKRACLRAGIAPADAAHRWLARHSKLNAALGDGIIIGASAATHVEQNVNACVSQEALPQEVLDAIEHANRTTKSQFQYFR